MAFVQVRIKGDKEAFLYLRKIKSKSEKEGMKLAERMANSIRDKAKSIVAPGKTGTGDLKDSIQVIEAENGFTVVAGRNLPRPYAWYQEHGFTPHRIWPNQLDSRSNLFQSIGMPSPVWKDGILVSRFTPFMSPAYQFALKRFEMELKRTADNIVRN